MGYKTAKTVLPNELIRLIQKYVDGEYLYIPRKEEKRRCWGETTGGRLITQRRNAEIKRRHYGGASVSLLANDYCLSPKTVYKIVAADEGKE